MKFIIEQLAIRPRASQQAIDLLHDLGADEWFLDVVKASGTVHGMPAKNEAVLQFNYQIGQINEVPELIEAPEGDEEQFHFDPPKPVEFEVLDYKVGANWLANVAGSIVSHVGMHISEDELQQWREFFQQRRIPVVQEVMTEDHTNPEIKDTRRYHYVIFGTRTILGFDLKFIVRHNLTQVGGL